MKEIALKKGDYKNSVKEQPGSSAVVQGISSDEQGIGYSGIGYVTSGVKTLSLAEKSGQAAVQPSYDNCINGTSPLCRHEFQCSLPRTFQKAQTRSGTLSGGKNHAVV